MGTRSIPADVRFLTPEELACSCDKPPDMVYVRQVQVGGLGDAPTVSLHIRGFCTAHDPYYTPSPSDAEPPKQPWWRRLPLLKTAGSNAV